MPGSISDNIIRAIDARIDLKIRQLTKSLTSVVSGGGYSVAPTSGGVPIHAHDGAAHSGETTDNHHAQLHAAAHASGQPDELAASAILYDPTVSGLTAVDVQAAIDEVVAGGGGGGSGLTWVLDVNETGASLASWSGLSGTWSSDGVTINQTDATIAQRIARFDTLTINAARIYEAELQGVTSGFFAGIYVFDGSNGNNGWEFGLDDSSNTIKAGVPGGVQTSLVVGGGVTTATWYKLRALILGAFAVFWLDGTLIGTFHMSGTPPDVSRLGLLAWGSCKFRNVKSWTAIDTSSLPA